MFSIPYLIKQILNLTVDATFYFENHNKCQMTNYLGPNFYTL